MMKTKVTALWAIACIALAGSVASAQLLVENFNFTGNLTANGYDAHSGAGTAALATTTGLTYAGYVSSGVGNAVLVANAGGEDASRTFAQQSANGTTVYYSFLVNVTESATTKAGDYFFHIGNRASATSFISFCARVFVKITSDVVNFGISNGSSSPVYGATSFAKNTPYLVMVAYSINTAGNDEVKLWVASSGVPATEVVAGTPEATETTTTGQDIVNAFGIRQGSSTNSSQVAVDGIRVATSWNYLVSNLVDTVTFRVNMAVKWQEGKFAPASGDTVRVVGSFNNWSATDTTVRMARNSGSDSIWVLTRTLESDVLLDDTVYYKFFKTNRGGDWESVNNRVYALVNGTHQTPVWYFDNDSTVNAVVNVTFQARMSIKMRELTFQPGSGDVVTVPGSFNGWNTAADTLKDPNADSIYTKTITANEGDQLFYKFYKTPNRGGIDWEGNQPTSSSNREYTVPVGGGNIPVAWFDNDSLFNQTVVTNITWQTDVAPYITLGWFDATKDSVEVRGGFTGWSGQKMQPLVLTPNIWQYQSSGLLLPVGDQMQYKFYLRLDSAGAVSRFPGLVWGGSSDNRDGFFYEHPSEGGDGNNLYTVQNQSSQAPQRHWFSGINPQGLLGANDSVETVTLKVNMGPATRYSNAFSYASDTVFVVWQDALWRSAQVKNQGVAFPQEVKMTRQSGTDSVYSVTFKVKGKTHYNMQYTYRFKKADGTTVDQGGGLGGQNPFITRFIRKVSGAWPSSHTAPTDVWQKDAPLPGETAQYTTDVAEVPAQPLSYELYQNYPNPFNPTTTIRYTLPQQATVKLRIYNILGQEVAELVNMVQTAGTHTVGFDAHRLSTGVYFYRIEAGTFVDIKKMVLLK